MFENGMDPLYEECLAGSRTSSGNYNSRGLAMMLRMAELQSRNRDLSRFVEIDRMLHIYMNWNDHGSEGKRYLTGDQMDMLCGIIDRGISMLDDIAVYPAKTPMRRESWPVDEPCEASDWNSYHGDANHSGHTEDIGPQKGRFVWKKPIGITWKSAPVIYDGTVLVSSPGMRTTSLRLDCETGKTIVRSVQESVLRGNLIYNTANYASTPKISGDVYFMRQIGSMSQKGDTHYIVAFSLKTGEELYRIEAGHIDYRQGYAAFDADGRYVTYLEGLHNIEGIPPVALVQNTVKLWDISAQRERWSFRIGESFSEPVLTENDVIVGNEAGYLYALAIEGGDGGRIEWEFHTGNPIRGKATIFDGKVYFADSRRIYCLDGRFGNEIWSVEIFSEGIRLHSFFHTSGITVIGSRCFFGDTLGRLICLSAETGDEVWNIICDDWIRSAPVISRRMVYAATLAGSIYAVEPETGELIYYSRIAERGIASDLVFRHGKLFVTTQDLNVLALSEDLSVCWSEPLLGSYEAEGKICRTETVAGGAFYQSKPTVHNGTVFGAGPDHILYALDVATGNVKWKHEFSGAVSSAPAVFDGMVFCGQQGGDDNFYCLDEKTGDIIWKSAIGWDWGSPAWAEGRIYVPGIDGWAYCLDADAGTIVWRFRTGKSLCTEPLVAEDRVLFGSWDYYLYALDKNTGCVIWQRYLYAGTNSGAPLRVGDNIYLPVGGRSFRCISLETGKLKWHISMDFGMFNATPCVLGDDIFIPVLNGFGVGGIPVTSNLIWVDARTGVIMDRFDGGGLTAACSGRNNVYFGSTTSTFFTCIRKIDGKFETLWQLDIGDRMEESTPSISGDRLFLITTAGYLCCIE